MFTGGVEWNIGLKWVENSAVILVFNQSYQKSSEDLWKLKIFLEFL